MMKKVRAYSITEEAIARETERVGGDPNAVDFANATNSCWTRCNAIPICLRISTRS